MKKNLLRILCTAFAVLVLSGCSGGGNAAKAPIVRCAPLITVEQYEYFNYKKACRVEGKSSATEIDTSVLGTQTLRITSENKGSITVVETLVSVVPEMDDRTLLSKEITPTPTPRPTPTQEIQQEDPEPTEEPEIEPTEESEPEKEPTKTCWDGSVIPESDACPVEEKPEPAPTPTPVPKPTPAPSQSSSQTSQQPSYTGPDYGHGIEYFHQEDYGGDVFRARDACVARLNEIGYGSCYPNATETYYTFEY